MNRNERRATFGVAGASLLLAFVPGCLFMNSTTSDAGPADAGVSTTPLQPDAGTPSVDAAPSAPLAEAGTADAGAAAPVLDAGSDANEIDATAAAIEGGDPVTPRDAGKPNSDAGRDGARDAADGEAGRDGSTVPDVRPCKPAQCGTNSWACWPMPNAPDSDLPNPARFTDLGDGTVRDEVTCLVWQRDVNRNTSGNSFAGSATACQSLTLAGGGWRLPTRIELLSVVDTSTTTPALDLNTFPASPPTYFWTASPWAGAKAGQPSAWAIDFYSGQSVSAQAQEAWYLPRCVRGGNGAVLPAAAPANQYAFVANGEILDQYTGLTWQQMDSQASGGTMSWSAAKTYCETLSLNDHTWRLPSVKELQTLVDDAPPASSVAPAINKTMFPATSPSKPYWTSTAFASNPAGTAYPYPWTVSFADGGSAYRESVGLAKCVR